MKRVDEKIALIASLEREAIEQVNEARQDIEAMKEALAFPDDPLMSEHWHTSIYSLAAQSVMGCIAGRVDAALSSAGIQATMLITSNAPMRMFTIDCRFHVDRLEHSHTRGFSARDVLMFGHRRNLSEYMQFEARVIVEAFFKRAMEVASMDV